MRKKASPAEEPDEMASLLEDPQVREFLSHYLSIPEPDVRAHLRRVVAKVALSFQPRSALATDVARRRQLRLSPTTARPKHGKTSS